MNNSNQFILAEHEYQNANLTVSDQDMGKAYHGTVSQSRNTSVLYQASLFQVVSESLAVTTPIINHASRFMVHYTERKMGTRLHRLNIWNISNTDEMQFGVRDVQYTTKVVCTTVNFTEVHK